MGLTRIAKKSYAKIFNERNSSGKNFGVFVAAWALGCYGFAEVGLLNDASDTRTPVIGEQQNEALRKQLDDIGQKKRSFDDVTQAFEAAQQRQLVAQQDPLVAQNVQQLKTDYQQKQVIYEAARTTFEQNFLLSEGISEADARNLMDVYTRVAGKTGFRFKNEFAPNHHGVTYLDECQIRETKQLDIAANKQAEAIDKCIEARLDFNQAAMIMMSGFSFYIFEILACRGAFLPLLRRGRRYEEELEAEEGLKPQVIEHKVKMRVENKP